MNQFRVSRKLITAAACACRFGRLGYRAGVARRRRGPGGVGLFAVAVAWLAAFGVPGVSQSAALASSPVLTWTKQAPATSPSARYGASMAYDAATGTAVLFGGTTGARAIGDTWVWDGTTWTEQHPAVHPPAQSQASMAYDAATDTVVLFGTKGATWTWDGRTWTKQHPAVHPPAQSQASMAYDAATDTVVLFGTKGTTWTWDGTTWTKQAPATSPSARASASMAYDAATGTVVLFGGQGRNSDFRADTWVWDGTTWTKQTPATSPHDRASASMAYDAATGTVVLFGGAEGRNPVFLADTWVWDGTTWTEQAPATSPSARRWASMAYDAATGTVVLFGGYAVSVPVDTWTWGPT